MVEELKSHVHILGDTVIYMDDFSKPMDKFFFDKVEDVIHFYCKRKKVVAFTDKITGAHYDVHMSFLIRLRKKDYQTLYQTIQIEHQRELMMIQEASKHKDKKLTEQFEKEGKE